MNTISKILTGTGFLIGMYLILDNAYNAKTIINSMGSVYTGSVKALQGRD